MKDDHRYVREDGTAVYAFQLTPAEIDSFLKDGLQSEDPADGPVADGVARLQIELVARSLGLSTAPKE